MKFKTIIHYKDANGNLLQEALDNPAMSERDARHILQIQAEKSKEIYGSNYVKAELEETN